MATAVHKPSLAAASDRKTLAFRLPAVDAAAAFSCPKKLTVLSTKAAVGGVAGAVTPATAGTTGTSPTISVAAGLAFAMLA